MDGSSGHEKEGFLRENGGIGDEGISEEGELKEAFDVFDKDKDGLISVEELGSVLCSLGLKEGNKMEDCKAMIRKVDMDGDGMVNFDEFKKMMKSSGGGLISVSAF
ncbi:Calcium-binding EF-hand [Corchorus capsularis]|uniref:Calcium-binding EF-hand n=1 Tax=Corchorus capsularis TaxID=210143 RepID=A0A1R3IF69_COCAP|nr:Calcium-binding EF-hand [Corchorus capsularis]